MMLDDIIPMDKFEAKTKHTPKKICKQELSTFKEEKILVTVSASLSRCITNYNKQDPHVFQKCTLKLHPTGYPLNIVIELESNHSSYFLRGVNERGLKEKLQISIPAGLALEYSFYILKQRDWLHARLSVCIQTTNDAQKIRLFDDIVDIIRSSTLCNDLDVPENNLKNTYNPLNTQSNQNNSWNTGQTIVTSYISAYEDIPMCTENQLIM